MKEQPAVALGTARVEPADDVVVGTFGTWRLTYRVGRVGLAVGGSLGIAWIWPSDWGEPQFNAPAAPNYTTARASNGAPLVLDYSREGGAHPYEKLLRVKLGAPLAAGEEIAVTFGDTSQGGRGTRAQTFVESRHRFLVLVDPDGSGRWQELTDSPTLRVVGGPAARLLVVAPSEAVVDEPFALVVRAEDRWGNPSPSYASEVRLAARCIDASEAGIPAVYLDGGVGRLEGISLGKQGIWRVSAVDESELKAESNPIVCRLEARPYRLLWGDIHGQCEIGCGVGTLEEYFHYARHVAGLDVCSNQANCFMVTNEQWAETQRLCRDLDEPGRFVTLLGYEWSGATARGGDHNIYLPGDVGEIRRASHELLADLSDANTDLPTIADVFAHYRGGEAIIVAHVGGRPADLSYHALGLQTLVEISSTHGRFEWFGREALARGYRVGFIAGSDGIMGRPGNDRPGLFYGRNVRSGLAGIFATSHTREAIMEALRARRCYGTSGERINLWVEANGRPMGAEFRSSEPPRLKVWVLATAPLEGVDLYRGEEIIFQTPDPDLILRDPRRILIAWSGAEKKGTGKENRVVWDGELRLSEGRILNAEPYGLESPMDAILARTERTVSWRSVTAGDADGLVLTVDASRSTRLSFRSHPASFDLLLGDLAAGSKVFPAGGVERQVAVSYLPALPQRIGTSFTYVDTGARPGVNAYWVRVRQADDGRAWSSPIYIEKV